nr:MAG TPA: hypothetical protein [Microviridae sp.]
MLLLFFDVLTFKIICFQLFHLLYYYGYNKLIL